VLRLAGKKTRRALSSSYQNQDISQTSTAIVFPIYNEDVARVYEGLRATYDSLAQTGQLERFDFFVLSDSTDADKWVEEERSWYDLVHGLGALGRIYYRRRINNEGKKSGNIREFLKAWGRRYRYFIIFDADSIMRGETLVNLVKMMEANRGVGLIQTVPAMVNAESLFGRMQQFANRFYTQIFVTGLDFWAKGFGNYWGHNAIIRTEPFMTYCGLPKLPGNKPFGGHILSHDFVEAALLVRQNWQVWLAYDLEGSYEEAPQGLIENAQRDRRWCQGNLQHTLVLFGRGLRGVSRAHLIQGIFGYLTGPLWLIFLLTFYWIWAFQKFSGLSRITVHSWISHFNLTGSHQASLIFVICMGILFLPRFLALVDIAFDNPRRRAFGGMGRVVASTVGETIFSTLHAPLQMLWHSQFVVTILMGVSVNWGSQQRAADGTSWAYAFRRQWGQTAIGLGWSFAVWRLTPGIFYWFIPIFAGMILAIPLSVFTSRRSWGQRARELGLFLTPEETSPPAELVQLRARLAQHPETPKADPTSSGLTKSILDPYINAIHVSLLRENETNPDHAAARRKLEADAVPPRALGEKLLAEGVTALQPAEKILVMSDAETMAWLHRQIWIRPEESVADFWKAAMGPDKLNV
ncbi:MAG TPA: glucans biosynthesis glucosyltransferase MdoH, partial [Candidatus Saccharimonadales bacterium]|nr:glucans biosynthesis glucosyltransferase MdoH [Candidatus Saccharimonadales bacterium]